MVEHTWIEGRETLPEPIIDFINRLPNLSPELYSERENKQFSDIVNFVGRDIISGEITYNKQLGKITYKFEAHEELPLQQASSLVVESSPLLLYLKYSNFVKRGTLIIIEEPEAHLHPDAQRVMARTLVRLVNRGLYIVLITHSPYIIQQINNCIRAYYLNKVDKLGNFLDEFEWQEDDILEPSKVASYLFGGTGGKVKVKKLEVDEKEGIPYDAFYPVLKDLHNETEKLRELPEGNETDDRLGED